MSVIFVPRRDRRHSVRRQGHTGKRSRAPRAGRSFERALIAAPELGSVTLQIDAEILLAMQQEGELVGDQRVEETIARRLTQGVRLAQIVGSTDLLWRPIRNGAQSVEVHLPLAVIGAVEALADEFQFPFQVLASTILYNDACKPWEVRQVEQPSAFGPLGWQPGRGNIYSMRFDLPGYQIVFLKMLARRAVERDQVVGEALLALARHVRLVGAVGGLPVSEEAFEFAAKMVRNADFQANSWKRRQVE